MCFFSPLASSLPLSARSYENHDRLRAGDYRLEICFRGQRILYRRAAGYARKPRLTCGGSLARSLSFSLPPGPSSPLSLYVSVFLFKVNHLGRKIDGRAVEDGFA